MYIQYKINLKSYHLRFLNLSILNFLIFLKKRFKNIQLLYLKRLATETKKIILLRSPVQYKSSREQFCLKSYNIFLNIEILVCSKVSYLEFFLQKNFIYWKNSYISVFYKKKIFSLFSICT